MEKQITFAFIAIITTINNYEAQALTFNWKYTLDADSPENYVTEEYSEKNCHGFYFPEFKHICMMSLEKLRTNEIFLPKTGYIYLKEGADIVLDPNVKHCIKVKPTEYKEWFNPDSWLSERSDNSAVPHLERAPCQCDVAVFPRNSLYASFYPTFTNFVGEIVYGVIVKDDVCPLVLSDGGWVLPMTRELCNNEFLCQSSNRRKVMKELCPIIYRVNNFKGAEMPCLDPVELLGHCTSFCGAVIRIGDNIDINPVISLLDNFLIEDKFDLYHSVVDKNGKHFIQISLTDKKEYTGESALRIEENQRKIRDMATHAGIFDIEIKFSGPPKNHSNVKQGFLIVLGTFSFVLLILGVIYGVFEKNLFNFNYNAIFPRRFNLSRYNQALRRSVIFSRFDNMENVSIAGSVLCLERDEFNNPLYDDRPKAGSSYEIEENVTKDDEENAENVATDEELVR